MRMWSNSSTGGKTCASPHPGISDNVSRCGEDYIPLTIACRVPLSSTSVGYLCFEAEDHSPRILSLVAGPADLAANAPSRAVLQPSSRCSHWLDIPAMGRSVRIDRYILGCMQARRTVSDRRDLSIGRSC